MGSKSMGTGVVSEKLVYRVGKKSKCATAAIVLFVLSAIVFFRILIGFFLEEAPFGGGVFFVLFDTVSLMALLAAHRRGGLHLQWFGLFVLFIGAFECFHLSVERVLGLVLIVIGIFICFMAHGVVKTKVLAILLNAFGIFYLTLQLLDLLTPDKPISGDDAIWLTYAIFLCAALLFRSIGILLAVCGLKLEAIPVQRKAAEQPYPYPYAAAQETPPQPRFCSHCGKEIAAQAVVCPHCGCAAAPLEADIPSTGLNILPFFIPLVGLILYCVHQDKAPQKAKALGKWAIIGFSTGIGGLLLLYLIFFLL